MAYTDYNFYENSYKGTVVPSSDFDELSERATDYLRGRILVQNLDDGVDISTFDEVKRCICRLVELAYIDAKNLDIKVSSETVGGYSRSFQNGDISRDLESRYDFAVRIYLGQTGFLFRGIQ